MKRVLIGLLSLCCLVLLFLVITGPATAHPMQHLGELTEGARLELIKLLR